jgi:predicted peroxiredoxin
MADRLLINLTRGPADPDRITVAFVMANAALALDKSVVVLLATEGVRVADDRVIGSVAEHGFPPLRDLWNNFVEGGGEVWACTPCVQKRNLEDVLPPTVRRVGAVAALGWLMEDGVSLSF